MNPIEPSHWDLAIAALLLLANAAISLALGLGLVREMLIAALRMVIQLSLIGVVLRTLFDLASPGWTLALMLIMALFAGWEVRARQQRRLIGLWSYGLGTTTMLVAGLSITLFGLTVTIAAEPWYDPRYAVPILGMILGNCMTAAALGLNTLTETLWRERASVDARLALGATRWRAVSGAARSAVRIGMIPIINSMAAAGVVALPGMMTGQIRAGVDPMLAIRYQILIMFLIAGGTGLGVLFAVLGGIWRLTDNRHRLRLDRLAAGRAGET